MRPKIYLANPYGFSQQQRGLLVPIKFNLEFFGEVWEPFERNNQVDLSKPGWAYDIGQKDVLDVRMCDIVFAVINGTPPDEGVMIEIGMALAWGKEVCLFRDDFRRCTDSEEYPLNLMVFQCLPRENWRDYYYTSVGEIMKPDKFLGKKYGQRRI